MEKIWESQASLDQYFPEHKVSPDEVAIMRFIVGFFKKQKKVFNTAIDFGAGPTIHRIVPLVPYLKEISIAEFLPESRQEVQKWLKGGKGARNWDTYIKKVLQVEGSVRSEKHITQRRALLRKKVKHVLHGDIFQTFPLGKPKKYQIVTSFYCADAVTASKKVWLGLMKNLSTLVAPEGWLLLTTCVETAYSILEGKKMHNVFLTEKDVHKALVYLGYTKDSIKIKVIPADMWSHVGISKVLVVVAQKPKILKHEAETRN
ncbi:MAG: guanitoxin biosynthesis pre-guanitoxin forming N-methyltransferase GntF [bacterium]|nr:guanitoxin biosynthesis pre-guanitoxin forming N-methyltransferase GntF [bacterium]